MKIKYIIIAGLAFVLTSLQAMGAVGSSQYRDGSGGVDINASVTPTAYVFDVDEITSSLVSKSGSQFTVSKNGIYRISYSLSWETSNLSRRNIRTSLLKNNVDELGASYAYARRSDEAKAATNTASLLVELNAGDYLELMYARHGSVSSAANTIADESWINIELIETDKGSDSGVIDSNLTINIPSDFTDINQALDSIGNKQISRGAVVNIQVNDCSSQTYTQPIRVDHRDGDKIQIIGNVSDPSLCVLMFNGVNGIEVYSGNRLGLIDGFTIKGNDTGYNGVLASGSSYINMGASMIVSNFDNGVFSYRNSLIIAHHVEANNNSNTGFWSYTNSTLDAYMSKATGNGKGYFAVHGSTIIANDAEAKSNVSGFLSDTGSTIKADRAIATNNSSYGFYALRTSAIVAYLTSSTGNGVPYSPTANTTGNHNAFISK